MKEAELRKAYVRACETKGFEPTEGQFGTWRDILGWCEKDDLDTAVTKFFERNTGFPMPSELKAIVGQLVRDREQKTADPTYLVVFICEICNIRASGFLTSDDQAERSCRSHCGPPVPIGSPAGTKRAMLPPNQVCGGRMLIQSDGRPARVA